MLHRCDIVIIKLLNSYWNMYRFFYFPHLIFVTTASYMCVVFLSRLYSLPQKPARISRKAQKRFLVFPRDSQIDFFRIVSRDSHVYPYPFRWKVR